jgi:hypothetical protein
MAHATARLGQCYDLKNIVDLVRYPILPSIERRDPQDPLCPGCVDEILHVRHHSLFVPRDFDVSPYFQVIKPTIEAGFDPRGVRWAQQPQQEAL